MSAARWWQVFGPMTEVRRMWEVENIILGADSVGLGGSVSDDSSSFVHHKGDATRNGGEEGDHRTEEIVVEVLLRGSGASSHGKRRSVERALEGWSSKAGACELNELSSLKGIWGRRAGGAVPGDTQVCLIFSLGCGDYSATELCIIIKH